MPELVVALPAQSREATVSGTVRDSQTGEAVVGAAVQAARGNTGTSTDQNGFFKLSVPAGDNTLTITSLGFEKATIRFSGSGNVTLNVQLVRAAYQLSEVGVVGQKPAHDNIRSVQSGMASLSINTIKTVPAFLGEVDVVKSIKLLPGVSSVGEAATGFNVRGGSIDQNLVLLDNAPIFNTSHLFGFFSVFNPDAVEDVTLYRGGIPAQYGGRISSVLDVRQREGSVEDFALSGGFGLISARLAVEGPIVKGKTSFLVAGRSSYSDWLLRKMPDANIRNSQASFYDLSAKISHTFSEKDKLTLSGYRSSDRFGFSGDTLYNWTTNAATLKYTHLFNSSFFLDITGVVTGYTFKVESEELGNASEYSNGISLKSIDAAFSLAAGKHQINFGAMAMNYAFQQGELKPTSTDSEALPVQLQQEYALEGAVYWNDEVKLSPRLSFMYGLRYSYYANYGAGRVFQYQAGIPKKERTITDTLSYSGGEIIESYHGAEPRVSINYMLNERSAVKLGYNRHRQYVHLISNTTAVSPTDFWKSSNTYVRPQIGDQLSIGYFRNFRQSLIETSVEAYYKQIENILDYKNGANLYLNKTIEADLLSGKGRAYGVETSVSKTEGKLTGWLNYTYARTEISIQGATEEETVNRGEYYPASYDKPHTFNLVSSYELSKRWILSSNFTYSTGRPVTAPVSHYVIGDYIVPNFGDRNQYRIPDYHRLDLSLSLLPNKSKNRRWESTWNFSIYNVYGRKNPYSVFFKQVHGAPPRAYQLAVVGIPLPSISYDFRFR
ncbi:carboxypeptidase-like regulatory domain-containing protein [Pontibacter korlensis]|uniref:TonB-dependent receptor n=1 Tax=Pontibacter korlensis TaxID=400092 RepID=UPI00130DB6ED|nr:carboxypeptidase-like regulatory domain-containing protein [Pontibacter korlensis]